MSSSDSGMSSPRKREAGETEAERKFWERYWEVLRTQGVQQGHEIWYERWILRFIRELKPRRLKETTGEDVTRFLGMQALQPEATGWGVRQADHALRILFQELVRCPWAEQWSVGLPEFEGWMEGPEGGRLLPVPKDAAQGRFAEQVQRMIRALRCLHYCSVSDWSVGRVAR